MTESVVDMLRSIDGPISEHISPSSQVNICSDAPQCGSGNAGCELENGQPVNPVGVEKTLEYSTDGMMKLIYRGPLDSPTGALEAERPQSGLKSTQ